MSREKSRGGLLTALGLLALLAAACLAGYNLWDGQRAGHEAQAAAQQLEQRIQSRAAQATSNPSSRPSPAPDSAGEIDRWAPIPVPSASPSGEMPVEYVNGQAYIGVLEIPSIDLSLPVMLDWDYQKLRTAPCRYSGSYLTDDLVVMGHNYATHFSPIKWLRQDAEVYFVAVDGSVYRYVVDSVETLRATQVEAMTTAKGWDLTLFTCTTGGQARCAVRCSRAPLAS